jgi:hypothetical protein
VDRSLTRWILSQTRGDDIAHDALVHLVGMESRAAQGFTHHQGTELHGRKTGQCTLKFSNGCAHSGDNDYIFHNGRPHFLDAEATQHDSKSYPAQAMCIA